MTRLTVFWSRRNLAWSLLLFLFLTAIPFSAAQSEPSTAGTSEESSEPAEPPKFNWQNGPGNMPLGSIAALELPDTFTFLDGDETRRLMEMYGNPPTNTELGLAARADNPFGWFVVFEFDEIGFVKDDDKENLDSDSILDSFRQGTEANNERRAQLGMAPMNVVGWKTPPYYDENSQNLEWCLHLESEGEPVLNHNIRVLGRRGVMRLTLVCDPAQLDEALAETRSILAGFTYQQGNRYADWTKGDKVAKYGLAALVTGGAAAVALKTGFFKKFLKPILVGIAALFMGAWKFFKGLFGSPHTEEEEAGQA